ncbi:MAG: hypothetical protein Q8O56_17510 [Solirubrobacteraceae bacterium]|nr:hypothetical protein [Solirubrobacteraceae bacterium]
MRALGIVAVAVLALAGCGSDDETQAETSAERPPPRTVTVTVPGDAPETSPDDDEEEDGDPETADLRAPAGLPEDGVALTGDFAVRIVDRTPAAGNASGESPRGTHDWRLTTSCSGGACRLEVRRRLDSGGFKDVTLRPIADRPGQWYGEFRGTALCGRNGRAVDQSLTIRPLNPQDGEGGQVATRFEAYFRADLACFRGSTMTNKHLGVLASESG